MKLIILGILSCIGLLFLSYVGTPYVYSFPRDLSKLKGNIKFLFIYDQEVKKDSLGRMILTMSSKTFVAFNKAGSYIISDAYWPKSRINQYFCKYDSKGNLIEMQSTTLQNDINITLYKHTYDAQGRVVKSVTNHNNDLETATTKYIYLPAYNKVIEYIDDKNFYKTTKIDTQHYSMVDRDYSKFSYKKKLQYKEADTVLEKNLKKIMFYNKNMDVIKIYTYHPKDSLLYTGFFEYDTNNYIISSKSYQKDFLVNKTTHSYIYDKIGNWTTDSIFDKDSLSHIMIRKFEYF